MDVTLTVSGRKITLPQNFPEQLTNTEKIDRVKFQCDAEYNGFSLVAVFRNGERGKTYPVPVPADRGFVDVDPRALRRAGHLYIGMFGINGLKVLPTAWSAAIELKEGTTTDALDDEETAHVLPGIYERIDALDDAVEELAGDVDELSDAVSELDDAVEQLDADVDALETTVAGKQDVINDLSVIRNGAAAGATALQSVPMSTSNTIGGVKAYPQTGWDGYGVKVNSNGYIYVARANDNTIEQRTNEYNPIVPKTIDKAVSAALCTPIREYTDEQKAAACATIGAEYKGDDNWENVAQLDTEQTQFLIDLTGYTEICIESHLRAAQNVNLRVNSNMILFSNIAINGGRSVYAEWKDNKFGFCSSYAMRSSAYDNVTDAVSCESQCYGGTFNINGITKFYLDAAITAGSITIYAR